MCCFSRPVDSVSATKIFARSAGAGQANQFLAYSMNLSAKEELAMVLPLPVRGEARETAVRFINLEKYPSLFVDLGKGFPQKKADGRSRTLSAPPAALPVVSVGSFDASYVPSVSDFERLDERFRLPPGTWDKLPAYRDFGFAVFKLKPGATTIHPMAFSFARANTRTLFFPTVHIHDGVVHPKAEFDHVLYCQRGAGERFVLTDWEESPRPAHTFIHTERAGELVDGEAHCYRRRLEGKLPNKDTILEARS